MAAARRAAAVVAGLLVWAVTAVAVGGWLFVNDSREIVLATHDARVSPLLGDHAVVRTGPVLPDVRLPSDGPVGVEIFLDKTNASTLGELLNRYAFIASQPDGQVAKVRETVEAMALDAALGGALAGLVPIGLWLLVGRRRRRELVRGHRLVAVVTVVGVTTAGGAVLLRPWVTPEQPVEPTRWTTLSDFTGLPVPDELARVEVSGDVLTRQTKRLVGSAINTYDKSKVFYERATERAADLDLREPAEDETVVLLVSDRHDNVGMDRVARAIAERAGATAVFDAGDDTSTGRPWEAFSLDSVTEAFEDWPRWSVVGNHDQGDFVGDYMDRLGWTRLDGEVVDGPGATTILGVDDPRASGLGDWRDETGLSFAEVTDRVTETACAAEEPVTTVLVHDTDLGREAVRRGCARLVVGGHTHVARGPVEIAGPDDAQGWEITNGTTGGAAYAIATGSKPRRPAVVTLLTYRDGQPVGSQFVTLQTDGSWDVGEYAELGGG